MSQRYAVLFVLTLLLMSPVAPAAAENLATANFGAARVTWSVAVEHETATLTVSRPDGTVFRREFKSGAVPAFDLSDAAGNLAADGAYSWQIVFSSCLSVVQKQALAAVRRTNDPAVQARALAAVGLDKSRVQSGTFAVAGGSIVPSDLSEGVGNRAPVEPAAEGGGRVPNDVVTADDAIIQGSACIGLDCVNNESFGFDTIRLKENNTRIKFEDTSTGAFPSTDWQLTANDSASGGANKFSIEDITGSRVPFTVTGGAATNSIFVDSTGRVGFRTSTPVLDLHVNTSNTPALRLEQNNSGGFTAQTWDVAGNEANFFVRDVTGGSRLPFRIRPGAPTSSIDISADGNVGIGTGSPSNKLHVTSSASGTADGKVLISNTSGTTSPRELLEVNNNGGAIFILKDTSQAPRWSFGTSGTSFVIDNQANGGVELSLTNTGNLIVLGTVTPGSSREIKQDFAAVDTREALNKVLALPITSWAYKTDQKVRHIGPMAEDFFDAFSVGGTNKGISVTDSAGVTLAAIQGLYKEVQQKNAELAARNAELENRLANLESMIRQLAAQPQ